MQRSGYFRIDWVLVDQLAIGPALALNATSIACVKLESNVCSASALDEATPPHGLDEGFRTSRYVLPDPVPDACPPLMNWKQL